MDIQACSFIVNVKKFVTHWMVYPVQIILGQNSKKTTSYDVEYPQKRGEVKSGQWDLSPPFLII